ncbi:signal peptidase II [Parapedobacter soli]|uniref:signal peptidase II n=1 Tax=Parapedobacter soli TaxID=416955 RepID=UPI0021C95357|nr:signal peptidase II [Parapedobacter soli]
MTFNRRVGTLFGLILISLNISCDQLTKTMVRNQISPHERIILISDHLTLTNIENSGAFLSMGQTWWQPVKSLLFIVLPIIVLLFGLFYMTRLGGKQPWLTFALGFAIGGGIGNMIDRLLYGSVTDFVHIRVGPLQTGIFNMADVSITIGVGMMLLFALRGRRQEFMPH